MKVLEKTVAITGKAVSWLTLVMVLLTVAIVIMRYGFNLGWIWLQESLTYLHVTVFTVVSAWALQQDGHVRVDIFYSRMPDHKRALVDLLGTLLFLVPFCLFVMSRPGPMSQLPGSCWKVRVKPVGCHWFFC
jgi:TRAP-type mannitol/chloroaromatic compound transport system permease small subunit